MQLKIIEIICGLLKKIPLAINVGMIHVPIGWILSEIVSLTPDALLIILIIFYIKSHKRMEKRQEEIIKLLKDKED